MMLKSLRAGEAKSRLARGTDGVRASAVYRALAEHQAAEIPVDWQVTVSFTPAHAEEEMKIWLGPHLPDEARFVPQCDGDLGCRLAAAVSAAFQNGSQRVFVIGGDCPGLCRDYFYEADRALSDCDIVIGPAQDGGYVLLGLKSLHAALFRDIPWSTPAVLDRTLAAADGQRLSVCLLKPLVDVDDAVTLDQQSNIYPFLKDGCST